MALNLTVPMNTCVFIGGRSLRVVDVEGDKYVTVQTDDGRELVLRNDRTVEVYPEVYVGVGRITEEHGGTRLMFEAPKHIPIIREKHYKKQASAPCVSA